MRNELLALEEIIELCEQLTEPELHYLLARIDQDLIPKARQKAIKTITIYDEVEENEERIA